MNKAAYAIATAAHIVGATLSAINKFRVSICGDQRCTLIALLSMATLVAIPTPTFGCSECGCSLSSDWAAQGYSVRPGIQTGIRVEYYNNIDLRSGRNQIDRRSLSFPSDNEVQQETLNHNTWFDLDYVASSAWAVSAQVPFHDRFHSSIAPGDTTSSESHANGVGDMRIVGRYQKFGFTHGFSFQIGFKLPSGRFNQNFAIGPQAGESLDRGLQLGSGTTDVLAGVSYFWRHGIHLGFFLQATADQPLAYRDAYLPSANVAFNSGVRYLNATWLTPQLQLNLRWDGRECGAAADSPNSGDALAYVSPGITAEIGHNASTFAFVQIPVYQRVNGIQLEPRWFLSVGLRYQFR